ncbi:adenylyltransferase/cytidyltransferase family protein [Candidatus Woesearchaeota archaeon]|nr:adenylyltransferase/cytidyltransferase family protein [Candidatus Woesearchaeota archaeon]
MTIESKFLDREYLAEFRSRNKENTIVFSTGCYDIFHSGHVVYFNLCKQLGDILVVGLARDDTMKKIKGEERPINTQINRMYLVAGIGDVDYVVSNDEAIPGTRFDYFDIMLDLKPDIFVINENDPGLQKMHERCDELGIKVENMHRNHPDYLESVSSTGIIERILERYGGDK